MRSELEVSLPDSGTIQRRTLSTDGMGGREEAWAAIGTVDIRISPLGPEASGGEEARGSRVATITERMITCPANTDVTTLDRMLTGGVTYEVVSARSPRSFEIARRLEVVEVD